MADPLAFSHDNSIDSILSEGSSVGGTPRRAHPARFPKPTTASETQGTLKASRLASPPGRTPTRTNSGGNDSILSEESPLANRTTASRKNSGESQGGGSLPPTTPSNINAGKNTKGRTSTARRSKMNRRKSVAGMSEDESSASEAEGPAGSEKIFEKAFQKYDKNDDGQIPMSDFLHFFDTLQTQLPPLSEPLLQPGVREQMINMMSDVMAQSGSPIYISKTETKDFYRTVAGKDITQELNDRRHGTFPKAGEVSSFRGRLEAARIPEDIDTTMMDTPRRGSAISPERRTPFGGSFARPTGPRRQQSIGISPFGEIPDDELSDLGSGEASAELTGNFLAASTPAQVSKRPGHGYFSPPIASPTHSTLSFGDISAAPGLRATMGSPGFNASAILEQDLANVHRELKQKQADFDEKEQELNELKLRVDRNREEFEDEIMGLNEEIARNRKDLSEKRAEIAQLNRDKDDLRAEAAVYLDQVSDAKKDIEQFHHQHTVDRENIYSLSQDNQKYGKQAADALRRVEALTADLQTVMEQKGEIEAQRASLQRKADLMTGLHKQIKDLREDQKEREFEIDRLRSELHSRQMDIEMLMTGNPTTTGGRSRLSTGPGTLGLLSDELGDNGLEDEDEDEEDEEEEEVVTTTKTIKRKKKAAIQKKGDTSLSDITSPEPFEIVERIAETSERGIQCDPFPWTAESGTSMEDDSPIRMFTTETQTDVTVPTGVSLQEHYEALAPLPPLPILEFSMDEEGLQKISDYEELAKEAELSRKQLRELSQAIGVQADVIERLKMLGEANATHKVRKVVTVVEKFMPGENPIAYLNYATFWLQNWLYYAFKRQFYKSEKGDEWEIFLASHPQPNMNAVASLLVFFILIFVMAYLIISLQLQKSNQDAMWKQLNTLRGYPKNPGTSGPLFGSRTWRVFKFDLQRMLYGQVRFPV
ncbi:hypothetical protein TWF594_005342 [Orbilia oligospora]|uniref:EF-hand domain-containing protein n=1 Tax=Orbilia oligospora TaxID=2813651 RepID=A0A7C8NZA8_ORBOL|nr:hypothetical protein TWF703_003802 [Orbilia oligospora]KAF3142952.1 hypothetical protein TWF594_005342 [Orbilia oligospora]